MANLQINNVATQADYAVDLTLGPDLFEAISVNVWNNSCVSQVFELNADGDYQLGQWSDESLEAANSTFVLQRCGGVRFKTNPAAGSSPARIVAIGIKPGGVQKVGGIQLQGTIAASGNVSPQSPVTTGIVAATGAITAGTGFTVVKNGTGDFTVTFTPAFAVTPVVNVNFLANAALVVAFVTNPTAGGFRIIIVNTSSVPVDAAFNFTATTVA